ncbi:uncharacterized protein BO87DRAFT_103200 [Aspergillus neoniger CBS 115656]|uniref:Uncharacterized protein n=1 Tax=Aspergillus neoniger (strain CBS 115656) TaxID=1448310 RepID=A0A318YEL9_ASPNB|nr:hypothetical protein BO87DRAFT_103200 [Aspergillus neoniger CBS 115656]PYH32559.1 hypothetical protein BO87DRAFT_103200 [Aspergillus neoniger CBS 115656]
MINGKSAGIFRTRTCAAGQSTAHVVAEFPQIPPDRLIPPSRMKDPHPHPHQSEHSWSAFG